MGGPHISVVCLLSPKLVKVEPSHFGGYKACAVFHALFVGHRVLLVEGKIEAEIGEFLFNCPKVFQVEGLGKGAGSVEEANLALGFQGMEKVHYVAAERSHTGATAHKYIFCFYRVVLRKEESPKGPLMLTISPGRLVKT